MTNKVILSVDNDQRGHYCHPNGTDHAKGETTMTDFNCNDFGTANPEHVTGDFTAAAYRVADAMRLPSLDANKFAQGYIHARQGRDDLLATGSAVYDAGHAAGSVAS